MAPAGAGRVSAASACAAEWADHACRHCGARLLERRSEAGKAAFECGSCGAKAQGAPDGICGCGILPRGLRDRSGPRFRCSANPAPGPSSLSVIVISFDEAAAA